MPQNRETTEDKLDKDFISQAELFSIFRFRFGKPGWDPEDVHLPRRQAESMGCRLKAFRAIKSDREKNWQSDRQQSSGDFVDENQAAVRAELGKSRTR